MALTNDGAFVDPSPKITDHLLGSASVVVQQKEFAARKASGSLCSSRRSQRPSLKNYSLGRYRCGSRIGTLNFDPPIWRWGWRPPLSCGLLLRPRIRTSTPRRSPWSGLDSSGPSGPSALERQAPPSSRARRGAIARLKLSGAQTATCANACSSSRIRGLPLLSGPNCVIFTSNTSLLQLLGLKLVHRQCPKRASLRHQERQRWNDACNNDTMTGHCMRYN